MSKFFMLMVVPITLVNRSTVCRLLSATTMHVAFRKRVAANEGLPSAELKSGRKI